LSRAAYFGQQGRYTKAILNCNEAINLKPNSVRAFVYRGALKYKINAFRLAVNDLSQAITLDNKCHLAYYNRALCHQSLNNLQQVIIMFVLNIIPHPSMYPVQPNTPFRQIWGLMQALDGFNKVMKLLHPHLVSKVSKKLLKKLTEFHGYG